MIGKRGARRLGAVMALALTMGLITSVTAAAALTTPTGNVDLRDILAGQARTFSLTITHQGSPASGIGPLATPADPDIDVVRITPPIGLISPTSARGPSGSDWSAMIVGDPPDIVFMGDTLAPQQTAVFQVDGNVQRPPADDGDNWLVEASDNGGQNFRRATGNFFTNIRVLQVQAVSIVAPQGATDLTVTATQDNVCARTRVHNAGSATLDVTPTLSASQVTVGQPRLANAASPCSSPPISSAPIAAGGTQEFEFPLTFGSAGTRTLVADASAPGADAFDTNVNVTVQPRAVLSYVSGSLAPRALPPGAPGVDFQIRVNKTPGGSPAIQLDASDTTFEFAGCTPPKQLASGGDIGAGGVSNVLLQFEPCNVLSIANGNYDVTGTYAYTDANDFVQEATGLNIGDQIRLDDLVPILDVEISPPASQVPGEEDAITDGTPFTVRVDVDDTREAGTVGPCPASNGFDGCEITESFLRFYDDANTQLGDVPFDIQNTNGRNSRQITLNIDQIPSDATQVQAFAAAVDDAGNESDLKPSNVVEVDIIRPFIEATETRPDMGRREIMVTFNEGVIGGTGDFSQLDWRVEVEGQNNQVTNVRRPQRDDGSTDFRRAILTVQNPLPCDVDSGVVEYRLFQDLPLGNTRFRDRVGKTVADQTRDLGDGIAPLAPIVKQVQGRGEQVGKFWFNDPQPATTVGNEDDGADCLGVADGYGLELYMDSNDNGEFDPGIDQLLATADADDIEATFTDFVAPFAGVETNSEQEWFERKVFVRAEDTNGNVSPVADVTAAAADFLLDQKAPTIAGVLVAGNDVTVSLSEDVPFGRDFALDWRFFGVRPGRTLESRFTISGVSGGPASRVLTIEDENYGPGVTDHRAEYLYLGPVENRYTDRAGNPLGDASVSAG